MWNKLAKRTSNYKNSLKESLLTLTDTNDRSSNYLVQEELSNDETIYSTCPIFSSTNSNILHFNLYYKKCDNLIDDPRIVPYRCIQNIQSSIIYHFPRSSTLLNILQIDDLIMNFKHIFNNTLNNTLNINNLQSVSTDIDSNIIPTIEPIHMTSYIIENCKSTCTNTLLIKNDGDISKMKKTDITFYLEEGNKIINANDYDEVNILRDLIIYHLDIYKIPLIISDGTKTYCVVQINDTRVLLIDPSQDSNVTCLRWEDDEFIFGTHTIWMILFIKPNQELTQPVLGDMSTMD